MVVMFLSNVTLASFVNNFKFRDTAADSRTNRTSVKILYEIRHKNSL